MRREGSCYNIVYSRIHAGPAAASGNQSLISCANEPVNKFMAQKLGALTHQATLTICYMFTKCDGSWVKYQGMIDNGNNRVGNKNVKRV